MKLIHQTLALVIILTLTACSTDSRPTLTVFAAASLTEAFTELAAAYETEQPAVRVQLNFAGSQTLRLQLESGATADVFASANQAHLTALQAQGLLDEGRIFARNEIVIIVPSSNPAGLDRFTELATPDLKLILAGEAVPIGQYSRDLLRRLGQQEDAPPNFVEAVMANLISEEDNVKGVLSKVRLGEADVGLVYRSDAVAASDEVTVIPLPPTISPTAEYPIAALHEGQVDLAAPFIEFVLSAAGQRILQRHGFD